MAKIKRHTLTDLAIENGLATEKQVSDSMEALEERRRQGDATITLEALLVERKVLTERDIRSLHIALERLNRDIKTESIDEIGNFEIIDKIGEGGLGVVYRARQISMGRIVALKVLHKRWLDDDEFKKRFSLEAKLVGRLQHPNLIFVIDVGRDRNNYYFAMEYIDGETVEDKIEREGPLPLEEALHYTEECVKVLGCLRQKGNLVHRDIEPSNMKVNREGVMKLGDFGFIQSKLDKIISNTGEVLGTPDYIAPEQAMGMDKLDWRSDQYSLGASLYHMLAGRTPFDGSGSAVMRKHISADVPDPRRWNSNIPNTVLQVLEKMMAKDPNDRYQDHHILLSDLERVRLGQAPKASRLDAGKSALILTTDNGPLPFGDDGPGDKAEPHKHKQPKTDVAKDQAKLKKKINDQRVIIVALAVLCVLLTLALLA